MTSMLQPEDKPQSAGPDRRGSLAGVRIARLSTVPFFVISQLKQQISAIAREGAIVTVVSSDEPELAILREMRDVSCVAIDMPRSISLWRDAIALVRLVLFFRRRRIQIAHSTTPKAGLLTALASRLAGVPIRLHTFTGQPWVNMRGIKRWLARTSDWLIGRLSTRCYADSASQRQFLIDQQIVQAGKISIIGDGSLAGVDLKRFDRDRIPAEQSAALRRSLDIPSAAPLILFLGRITVDKGVRELLEAFERLKQEGSDAHLVFVGRFDADSGVSGSVSPADIECLRDVHLAGYATTPENFLAIADLLCLPSYREGFGTVVIEAAAMGVPTVGTEIYGLTDAVENGKTGMLVPPRNAGALKDALQVLLQDQGRRKQMGAAARQRVTERFDADKVNQEVMFEYRKLLAAGGCQ